MEIRGSSAFAEDDGKSDSDPVSSGAVKHGSLTSLREKRVKIGARIVGHGRDVTFQMAVSAATALAPQLPEIGVHPGNAG